VKALKCVAHCRWWLIEGALDVVEHRLKELAGSAM
jgi:hypothetical protein